MSTNLDNGSLGMAARCLVATRPLIETREETKSLGKDVPAWLPIEEMTPATTT